MKSRFDAGFEFQEFDSEVEFGINWDDSDVHIKYF